MTRSLALTVFCSLTFLCKSQNDIFYHFDQSVLDSLYKGVKLYEKLYNKSHEDLKIYALVEKNFNNYEVYLLEYSTGMPTGVVEVIENSRRKLKITKDIVFPILFSSDILSEQIQKDKIAELPYAGYYVEVLLEDGKQKVTVTTFLF